MSNTFTSQIRQVELNNPTVETLNYSNNLEIVTTENATTDSVQSAMFFANISSGRTLADMASLASVALAKSGQATITYDVEQSGQAPSGSTTKVFVIQSLEFGGKTISV